MSGWRTSTVGITDYSDLPVNAQLYVDKIEKLTHTKVVLISTGPERDQTIVLEDLF